MTRPASRSWVPAVLGAALLVASVVAQFGILSWSMSLMVGGSELLGPVRVSQVAAVVIILISVQLTVFVADGRHGFRLFTAVGDLPPSYRRRYMIVNIVLLIAIFVVQVAAIHFGGLLTREAAGAEGAMTTINIVPGLGLAAGDPVLTALGCLLPIVAAASVYMLVGWVAGTRASGSEPEREPTVTRL